MTNIRFPFIASLVTLLAIAVLVKLGFWQLERAEQKRQLFADYEQHHVKSEATELNELNQVSPESHRFHYAKMRGEFIQHPLFLLDNQINEGVVGYHVIILFQPEAKPDRYVPVNMGWLPAPASRQVLPEVSFPAGEHELTGFLYFPSENRFTNNLYETDLAEGRIRVQEFLPDAVADQLNLQLTDYTFLLESPQTIGWQRDWQPRVMPPEKHQGYAVQWFSLAIACLVIFLFAVIKLNKQPEKEETR